MAIRSIVKVPAQCPACGGERLIGFYRARERPLCRRCNAIRLGNLPKSPQAPDVIAKRVSTARANGALARNVSRLAELNRGSHISESHRERIRESNRTRVTSPESSLRRSEATQKLWRDGKGSSHVGTGKRGRRHDLGPSAFRSSWEANFARVLNACGVGWEFEPVRYPLPDGCSYAPDFRLPNGVLIEVKGFWRPDALQRFALFNAPPALLVVHVIDRARYGAMRRRWRHQITLWEADGC